MDGECTGETLTDTMYLTAQGTANQQASTNGMHVTYYAARELLLIFTYVLRLTV